MSGPDVFHSDWQAFRTGKGARRGVLELTSAPHTYSAPGTYVVAVQVIDLFGVEHRGYTTVTVGDCPHEDFDLEIGIDRQAADGAPAREIVIEISGACVRCGAPLCFGDGDGDGRVPATVGTGA